MLTADQRLLCNFQATLFERSLELTDCSTPVFLRRFFLSDFAWCLDQSVNLPVILTPESAVEEINAEFGATSYGKVRYSPNELHWIGYISRYWCLLDRISSRSLYRQLKPVEMKKCYRALHSLDPEAAIERMWESYQLPPRDLNAHAEAIYRRMIAEGRFRFGL